MNLELIEVMRQIERSRKVDKSVLIDAIKAALISASRKNYGTAQDINVVFNAETGDLYALVKKTVVSEIQEPWREISLEEARRTHPDAQVGEEIEQPMAPSEFGRIAAQTAKQVVVQRVRESERNNIYEEFKQRLGELINGVVLRLEQRNVILDLGDTEAILPSREQIPREHYQIGDRVKCLIIDVRRTSRSPQVVVSRSHPGFIKKLFEMEVPEVSDGVVEIKNVAREAGARSKVAVASRDKNVDPVGACVGLKGSRVQAIVREIKGEKIDVIPYSENVVILLEAALQPAKVVRVILSPASDQAVVVVPAEQLSLAIGKNGQNVRLAAKLTNHRIDMVSDAQYQDTLRKQAEEAFLKTAPALENIKGIGPKLAEKLKTAGYADLSALLNITAEQLKQVPGVGDKTAEKILSAIKDFMPTPETVKKTTTAAELFARWDEQPSGTAGQAKLPGAGELFAGLDGAPPAAAEAQPEAPAPGTDAGQTPAESDAAQEPVEPAGEEKTNPE